MKTTSPITLWIINTCRCIHHGNESQLMTICRSWNIIPLNGSLFRSSPCRSHHYIPITCSTSKKKYPRYSAYMKYFQKNIIHYIPITWSTSKKNYPLYFDCMKYFGKKLSTIYIPITWSTSENNYPLYSDYMKYFGKQIIHYIPITWSTSKKNYTLYSDYMKYFEKKCIHYIHYNCSISLHLPQPRTNKMKKSFMYDMVLFYGIP